MTTTRIFVFALALVLCSLPSGRPQSGPKVNPGTITLLAGFGGQGYSAPGQLIEVTPGTFAGIAVSQATAFQLTSQGVVTPLFAFPHPSAPGPHILQALNGRIYGAEINASGSLPVNYSFNATGNLKTYPQVLPVAPIPAVQLPTGKMYGTEWDINKGSAFVEIALSGAVTVLHTFTKDEGTPYGLPILASDGNFYGISGIGTQIPPSSTRAMVYRLTPGGKFAVLASYPDGRSNAGPGSFEETLVQAGNGNLYGTAALGGSQRAGAIFELTLDGTLTNLYEFSTLPSGAPTFLIEGTDGNLYGVAQGKGGQGGYSSLFQITPSGQFTLLQVLSTLNIGSCQCWLTIGTDGKFYGTAENSGPGNGSAWVWDLGLPPPKPKVTGVLPTSGAPGAVVTVYGEFLLGATGVSFNGTPATTFSNISGNYVSVTVPSGATTGPITVTTANGSSTSAGSFTVE
ncbi:MAG: choice-of-anchor tandem repeat GloVer-containing protein [Bryobacteraceae bacterium]|jgi:uncharacterized repeat protein (TIGR03803 family)